MAAPSDAAIMVEAEDDSGFQAQAISLKRGKKLIIFKQNLEEPRPRRAKPRHGPGTFVAENINEVPRALGA